MEPVKYSRDYVLFGRYGPIPYMRNMLIRNMCVPWPRFLAKYACDMCLKGMCETRVQKEKHVVTGA